MTKEEMQSAARARPFKPFKIRLADGELVAVPHSDHLSHSPNWRTVIVWNQEGGFRILDTALVTALEFQEN